MSEAYDYTYNLLKDIYLERYPECQWDDYEFRDLLGDYTVYEEIPDKRRWKTYTEYVVKLGDIYVAFTIGEGNTEYQEDDQIDPDSFFFVEPYRETITKYKMIKEDDKEESNKEEKPLQISARI